VELQLVGTVWRIVLAFLLCSSSAQISSSSKTGFMTRSICSRLLDLIAAGGVPKNGRNNSRIFNRLEILADALLASVRESVSG